MVFFMILCKTAGNKFNPFGKEVFTLSFKSGQA